MNGSIELELYARNAGLGARKQQPPTLRKKNTSYSFPLIGESVADEFASLSWRRTRSISRRSL